MNNSAYCCDDRLVSQNSKVRKDYNLPDDGFIFGCFNNNFKISPLEFDIWMNALVRQKIVTWR